MTLIKSKPSQILTQTLTALSLILFLPSCHIMPKNSISNDTANEQSNQVVATYEDGEVTLQDANQELAKLVATNDKLKNTTFEKLNTDQKQTVIKEIVLQDAVCKEAKKRNLDQDRDYQEALKNLEYQLLQQKLILAITRDVSDEANLRKNYDQLVEKLKDKKDLRISYIALKTESEANALHKKLVRSPKSFAEQAKRKSIDKEIAKKGGDLGFALEDAIPADILKQAKMLTKGQISKPFLTSGKWIIIKLEDERPAEVLTFEKSKSILIQNLAQQSIADFAAQSTEKAKINILTK